jgi:hypothetical protein
MAGIPYVQVTEDQLEKISCPTCKKVGTLEFVSYGSSAVVEGAAGDAEQTVACSEGDFESSEAHSEIQAAAKRLREQASLRSRASNVVKDNGE